MNWYKQLHVWIILGLVFGLGYGILSAAMGWGAFTQAWISPFGDIFLNALFMIAVPLVLGSIITGVASLSDTRKLARIGGKTILIYISTTVAALIIGLLLVNVIRPGDTVPEEVRMELQAGYSDMAEERQESAASAQERGPLQAFVDMVPRNIAAAASNNRNMLQVVLISILFGIALLLIPKIKPSLCWVSSKV